MPSQETFADSLLEVDNRKQLGIDSNLFDPIVI